MQNVNMPTPRIRTVIINSESPERLVTFWSSFLAVDVLDAEPDPDIIWIKPDSVDGVNLGFQRVEAAAPASRAHLDVAVEDLDAAQQTIESLAGSHVETNSLADGFEWRVVADPDGNEFCIFQE